jgi:hypothetical protein
MDYEVPVSTRAKLSLIVDSHAVHLHDEVLTIVHITVHSDRGVTTTDCHSMDVLGLMAESRTGCEPQQHERCDD